MLDLKSLKAHNSDILKAEIGALLFNMGKTHAGINNWREKFKNGSYTVQSYFSEYDEYYDGGYFYKELKNISPKLEKFFSDIKVYFSSQYLKDKNSVELIEIMKARKSSESLSKNVFFRGCENINSGIDKGTPEKEMTELFIANAFGTFKKEVLISDMDNRRKYFWNKMHVFLDNNDYYNKTPNWKSIRKWIFDNMKPWYSSLLSDNRVSINDVTLWDQVYMVASMFKAVLANMYLVISDMAEQERIKTYFESPANIKWRIMGIQYDKLGLAERGFKPAQIKWYRETANTIDEKIKYLVETCYSLGNEIYRDETGIYFLVGEDLGEDDKSKLTKLHSDLTEVKNKILNIFKTAQVSCCNICGEVHGQENVGEFYPAIFLTKPSRGLMNLTFLLEEAKDNFLQPDYPQSSFYFDSTDKSKICPVCCIRAFSISDRKERKIEDMRICDKCYEEKTKNRINEWLKTAEGETIWTSELQDKNGRIALVTMKFELKEWLNGNMLNRLLIRQVDYCQKLEEIKMFFRTFFSKETVFLEDKSWLNEMEEESIRILHTIPQYDKSSFAKNVKGRSRDIKKEANEIEILVNNLRNKLFSDSIKLNEKIEGIKYNNNFNEIIELFYRDLNSLGKNAKILKDNFQKYKGFFEEEIYNKYVSCIDKLIERITDLQRGNFFITYLATDESYKGCKKCNETFNDWIRQVFFGSITGNEWEDFVKNRNLGEFINWDKQEILWDKWSKDEIELFSILLLQFIIRKNPSPARLRRIWETTKDFFEEIENKIIEYAGIENERCRRLLWKDIECSDGEYQDGEILFWANKGTVYMISPVPEDKDEFILKPYGVSGPVNTGTIRLLKNNAVYQYYKPYFSIIESTPVSWEFAIPAGYVSNLIRKINSLYKSHFKLVFGKLHLHTGVIIQDYKKPLYVGIKALRKIRRDDVKREDLEREIKVSELKLKVDECKSESKNNKDIDEAGKYYMIYEMSEETTDSAERYSFYLYPDADGLRQLKPLDCAADDESMIYYPNTFDFEFLDTNTRRNEIFYQHGKRVLPLKNNRPYTMEEAEKIMELYEVFNKISVSQFHKFIIMLYRKYEEWDIENNDRNVDNFKLFLVSLLLNTCKLTNAVEDGRLKDNICKVLGISSINELLEKNNDEIRWIARLFFDVFEFWHKALKE
ncbi:MAG: CRISPR-associated protein Csx11 [Clostridiaceae bacterium]|nr:CRISPR-associated protein Csx11 [Clostridiaceae bacterium]